MDAPTWWNNRFWRPLTAFSGDTRLQRNNFTTSSHGTLSPWMANTRLRDRRTIKPNLRTDQIYRNDANGRPLGSLRVSHVRRASYDSTRNRPSSAQSGSHRNSIPGQPQMRVETTNIGSTVPHNALQYFPRASTAYPGNRGSSYISDEQFTRQHQLQGQQQQPQPPQQHNTHNNAMNEDISIHKTVIQPRQAVQQSIVQPQTNQVDLSNSGQTSQAVDLSYQQQQRNVISARYGRRIMRPHSGGIITKVGELKLVDLEETLNIQPHSVVAGAQGGPKTVKSHEYSAISTSPTVSNNPPQNSTSTTSLTAFIPTFNGNLSHLPPSQIISQPPRIALKSILKKSEDNSSMNSTVTTSNPLTSSQSPQVAQGTGQAAKTMVHTEQLNQQKSTEISNNDSMLAASSEGNQPRDEQVQQQKSIEAGQALDSKNSSSSNGSLSLSSSNVKNNSSNGGGTPLQQNQQQNLSSVTSKPPVSAVSHTVVASKPVITTTASQQQQSESGGVTVPITSGVSPNWPVNRPTKTGMSGHDSVQSRILLRRGMRSAPSLKREVRFDMRNNNVIEFHPSDSIIN